jgi:hypothetical protein
MRSVSLAPERARWLAAGSVGAMGSPLASVLARRALVLASVAALVQAPGQLVLMVVTYPTTPQSDRSTSIRNHNTQARFGLSKKERHPFGWRSFRLLTTVTLQYASELVYC